MRQFVALDFETANENRSSACALGMVRFDADGRPTSRFETLIRPHESVDYFNPINTWVHGLTADDVATAPTWAEVYKDVVEFVSDDPIVAHNMAFDGYVLSDVTSLYGLPLLQNRKLCTLRLARKVLAQRIEKKSLKNVFQFYFPADDFDHHRAVSDANACGMIFSRMQHEYGYSQLELLCPESRSSVRTAVASTAKRVSNVNDLLAEYGMSADVLKGERVVFTGTLEHCDRATAQELVIELGGTADKNTTRKTTILVIGVPNPRAWSEGSSESRKMQKASDLREKGFPIVVMSEQEFFDKLRGSF